jgi:hypothetical protein
MVPRIEREGCVMEKFKEHLAFPGIVMLVVGAVAFQVMRADAVALPSNPPAVVMTIPAAGVMQSALGSSMQTAVDPI